MSDTHINAFYGAVDEAKAKVLVAQGELAEAERCLEAKKRETGVTDSEPVESDPVKDEDSESEPSEVQQETSNSKSASGVSFKKR